MTNKRNGTLYTGVTARLAERVQEHRMCIKPDSFTSKYACTLLVFYLAFSRIEDAISEEKRIKNGSRIQKINLIESINPEWEDLWDEIKEW